MKNPVKHWFPNATHEQTSKILWNLTAYPAGDKKVLERQLRWAACRTMPELPGFDARIDEAIDEALRKMDAIHANQS